VNVVRGGLYRGVVEAGTAVDQAVGAVVDTLLRAYREQDPVAVSAALSAPVLRELDRQHLGMGNIHLAFAFARVLAQECPAGARYENGVPRMDYLVGDGIELPGYVEARMAVGERSTSPHRGRTPRHPMARPGQGVMREKDTIAALLDGTDLVEPGLTWTPPWRPEPGMMSPTPNTPLSTPRWMSFRTASSRATRRHSRFEPIARRFVDQATGHEVLVPRGRPDGDRRQALWRRCTPIQQQAG
jgi:S-adenosyl methyltransferase